MGRPVSTRVCKVVGCEQKHHGLGWCSEHYNEKHRRLLDARRREKWRLLNPPKPRKPKRIRNPKRKMQVIVSVKDLLVSQYTLDFGGAGIDPPLVPTVNCPAACSETMLKALMVEHASAPLVTTWHRDAVGCVEIRCASDKMNVGAWAAEKFNGDGTERRARIVVDCQTISL